jgi:hypothetical protein
MNIEVKPLPEGDFIENLIFTVAPKQDQPETDTTRRKVATIRQEDTTRFKVQLGSFRYYENAAKAVGIAQHLFDQTFCIQFNSKTQLNAVRSMPITGLENAAKLLEQIRQKSEFKDPALVVMEENDRLFSVQLGAFSTAKRAERFISDINDRLDMELYYYKDPIDKLFKVRTEGTSDHMLAKKKLNKLRSTSEFHDAFIPEDTDFLFEGTNYSFQLRISGISRESQITIPEDISSEQLVNGPQKDMITFQGFTKWKELLSIQNKIRKLNPGIEPVIILRTKAGP